MDPNRDGADAAAGVLPNENAPPEAAPNAGADAAPRAGVDAAPKAGADAAPNAGVVDPNSEGVDAAPNPNDISNQPDRADPQSEAK